jgi:hypothetical protein
VQVPGLYSSNISSRSFLTGCISDLKVSISCRNSAIKERPGCAENPPAGTANCGVAPRLCTSEYSLGGLEAEYEDDDDDNDEDSELSDLDDELYEGSEMRFPHARQLTQEEREEAKRQMVAVATTKWGS